MPNFNCQHIANLSLLLIHTTNSCVTRSTMKREYETIKYNRFTALCNRQKAIHLAEDDITRSQGKAALVQGHDSILYHIWAVIVTKIIPYGVTNGATYRVTFQLFKHHNPLLLLTYFILVDSCLRLHATILSNCFIYIFLHHPRFESCHGLEPFRYPHSENHRCA